MDDFGNCYQTDDWAMNCQQYIYSMCIHGMMDDEAMDIWIFWEFDYCHAEI